MINISQGTCDNHGVQLHFRRCRGRVGDSVDGDLVYSEDGAVVVEGYFV